MLEIEVGVVGGEEDGVAHEINELYTTVEDGLATVGARHRRERPLPDRADVRQRARRLQAERGQAAPEILKDIQEAVGAKHGLEKPFDTVFHGGSGSSLEEIRAAVDYGVIKMNVDTDTQYAFTARPPVTCSSTTTAC